MNRTQRRYYGRPTRRMRDVPRIGFTGKRKKAEIEEVFPPRWKRNMQSRCCYTTPDKQLSDEDTDSPAEYIAAAKRLASPTRPVHSDITAVARRRLEKEKNTTEILKDLLTNQEITQEIEIDSQNKVIKEQKESGNTEVLSKPDPNSGKQRKNVSETQILSQNFDTAVPQDSIDKCHKETTEKIWVQTSIIKSQKPTINHYQNSPKESIIKSQRSPETRQFVPYIVDLDIKQHKRRMIEARKNYTAYNNFANNMAANRKQNGGETRRLALPAFKSVAQQYSIAALGVEMPNKAIMTQLQQFQTLMCECARPTADNGCQYVNPKSVESGEYVTFEKPVFMRKDEETLTKCHSVPNNLRISEVPNVKIVAIKFTKYNKDNIQLRRIDEKIVCVEYQVFDKDDINTDKGDDKTPVQKLRAFFSIKPPGKEAEGDMLTELPSTIKTKFNISSTDLKNLSQKEIEIIDGTILENQSYLHDLRTILRRKQNYAELTKETLNLHALYEMGKQELLHFDCNLAANEMTKDKLTEMQNLILKNTKSSIHGIRRMNVKNSKIFEAPPINRISKSLINELLKSSTETVVV